MAQWAIAMATTASIVVGCSYPLDDYSNGSDAHALHVDSRAPDDAPIPEVAPFDAARCPATTLVCGATCVASHEDPLHCSATGCTDAACADGRICKSGACTCRPGLTLCGGGCVELSGDAQNCQGCGQKCTGGEQCTPGSGCSGAPCPEGRLACGRSCWDAQNDSIHCGTDCASIKRCKVDQVCIAGSCVGYVPAIACGSASSCDCGAIVPGSTPCPGLGSNTLPICVSAATCPTGVWK